MATNNPYQSAAPSAVQRAYGNVKQSEQSSKEKKEKGKNNIAAFTNAVIADQVLNDGNITNAIWTAGKEALGFGAPAATTAITPSYTLGLNSSLLSPTSAATTVGTDTNLASALAPGVDPQTGYSLGGEAGTSFLGKAAPGIGGLIAAKKTADIVGNMPTGRQRFVVGGVGGALAGAGVGASIGAFGGPIGAGLGAAIGAGVGLIGSEFGSSKDKDQMSRDAVRKYFQKAGFVDQDYNVRLADGSTYNIGVDGKAKAEYGVNPQTGKAMHAFDLDQSNPIVKQLIPLVNPLVNALTGGDKKLASDFTGYLVRAAMSNSGNDVQKAITNIQSFYRQLNASPAALSATFDKMVEEKRIDKATAQIYKDDATRATSGMKWGDSAGAGFGGFSFKMPEIKKLPMAPLPYNANPNAGREAYMDMMSKSGASNPANAYSNFASNFNIMSPALSGENKK
jgi:hypothetical protein